jgi:hypothetical protein
MDPRLPQNFINRLPKFNQKWVRLVGAQQILPIIFCFDLLFDKIVQYSTTLEAHV